MTLMAELPLQHAVSPSNDLISGRRPSSAGVTSGHSRVRRSL